MLALGVGVAELASDDYDGALAGLLCVLVVGDRSDAGTAQGSCGTWTMMWPPRALQAAEQSRGTQKMLTMPGRQG